MGKVIALTALVVTACFGRSDAQVALEWAESWGGLSFESGRSIVLDHSRNIYTTGQFYSYSDFDPNPGILYYLTSAGEADVFVSKLNASGELVWARSIGGVSEDQGYSIALDTSMNIYVAGYFKNTADFDPSPDTFNLTSSGDFDIFVCKLDTDGNFLWAKNMGGINADYCYSIVVDISGDVYLTGLFSGQADFDPGINNYSIISEGATEGYLSKLDPNGDFVWAKKLGGIENDLCRSIATDAIGNIFITGNFSGTVDFDPGLDINNLTSTGNDDIFVSRFDSNGDFIWVKSVGGATFDNSSDIAVDVYGDVYFSGEFSSIADFDPGPTLYNLTSVGSRDAFICKLNNSGDFIWVKSIGQPYNDFVYSMVVDSAGGVITTGTFSHIVDFDPSPDTFNLTASGFTDVFILKLDANGNFDWAGSMGGIFSTLCYGIALDTSMNIYLTGNYSRLTDFDPGPNIYNLNSVVGSEDIFVCKLSNINVAIPEPYSAHAAPHLYPNPTTGSFTLELQAPAQISLFNTLGEKVYQVQVLENVSQHDLGGLVSGVYYLQVASGEGVGCERVVVARE